MGYVRSLRVQYGLSGEVLHQGKDEAILHSKRYLADHLVRDAQPYGAVVDQRDIEFIERGAEYDGLLIMARWFPAHGVVEFHGGPADGEVREVPPQMIGQPILLVSEPAWTADLGDAPVPTPRLEYRLGGWHEETRAWVYRHYL